MKITWDNSLHEAEKIEIEKHLMQWNWLIPKWCLDFTVYTMADEQNVAAKMITDFTYRRITLEVHANWFTESDYEKGYMLVHEMIHGFINPVKSYSYDMIEQLCPKEEADKFNKVLHAGLTEKNEGITQDFAKAIYDRFNQVGE